jgi:hypothetical protein
MWNFGAVLAVNDQSTLLILLDSDGFNVEAVGDWTATNGNEDNISIELVRRQYLSSIRV